jgi:hypothetical protein
MQMTYAVGKVPFPVRVLALGGFGALGMAAQVLVPSTWGFVLGIALMVPGLVLAWAKNYRNKPADLGKEDWQPATGAEFTRIRSNLAQTRQGRFPVLYKGVLGVVALVACAAAAFFLRAGGRVFAATLVVDGFVLLVPVLFSGNVRLWTPQELAQKMGVFEAIVAGEKLEGGDIVITPYLRLDRDSEGRQVPEDVRLVVEPRRKPADFLGVQMQVAINKGPNGPVPYLYAVFLCRAKGPTFERFSADRFGDLVKEPGGDREYGWVVVRQRTQGGGYHTTPADCRELFALVKQKLQALPS